MRNYFDLLDQDALLVDEEALEFSDIGGVEQEATRAMADAARESFQPPIKQGEGAIEVRDDSGPVMRVRFKVEIERLRKQ